MPDQIYSVKWNDVSKKNYTYDGLGRVTSQTVYPSVGVSLENTYAYKDVGENNTSTQVSRVTNALGTYDYEYDASGNITKITFTAPSGSSGSYVREYQYDHLNRITSTYDSKYGYRHEYEYDTNSNIISRNRYYNNSTEPDRIYTYDYDDTVWTDLLTAFCGDEITYDEIGNPLDYYNDTVFTWQNGRQLASITKGGKTTTYTYNADGQRISKTVDGVTTEFIYAGDILAGQKTGDNILMWVYDNNGSYIGFTYNGVEYYYVYNLQGDVEAITDSTGAIVAKYGYDTWGYVEYEFNYNGSINIAEINPIRYRGYYYDSERGLYYLNSRYYDPFMCRFINADGYVTTGQGVTSFNMFAYCGNNPVNRADDTGYSWWSAIKNGVKKVCNTIKKAVKVIVLIGSCLSNPINVIKEIHYNRNILNNINSTEKELKNAGYSAVSSNEDKLHQNNKKNGERNRKYVINEGWFSQEVVFYSDGTVNNTPEDMGTFNVYYGDNEFLNFVVHGLFDVLPYVLWGNSEDDTTMIWDRLGIND